MLSINRGYLTSGVVAALLLLTAVPSLAAADEIQVYTEEMDDPGQFGIETHMNLAVRGSKVPAYPGEKPSNHMLQITPEFSYGVTKSLEAGLYVPFAIDPHGNSYNNGLRFRLKTIAPRDDDSPYFWGMNTEVGYATRRVSESYWGMELRPIVGYRGHDWLVAFNPILDMSLSNNISRQPNFEPALKITRKATTDLSAGVEYYGEYGPLRHILPAGERAHYLYAVMDFETNGMDINFGIGRGFDNAGDKWVAKAIIAFPFK